VVVRKIHWAAPERNITANHFFKTKNKKFKIQTAAAVHISVRFSLPPPKKKTHIGRDYDVMPVLFSFLVADGDVMLAQQHAPHIYTEPMRGFFLFVTQTDTNQR
jgi:hypothetical protein